MVTCAPTCIVDATFRIVLGRFAQKKECQVKSSQVQISMAAAPAAFGAPAGARDRDGATRRNWHGWILAPSRGFIHPHRLLLDHRGAPGHHLRAFFRKSTVWLCKPDPGRRRERSGRRGGARTCTARASAMHGGSIPGFDTAQYCPSGCESGLECARAC